MSRLATFIVVSRTASPHTLLPATLVLPVLSPSPPLVLDNVPAFITLLLPDFLARMIFSA